MIKELQVKNFKCWQDTGRLHLAPLTGLFGTNSSGKTSILQLLLMMKQTVESTDRRRALHVGDNLSIVDLGTFHDLIHGHKTEELPLEVSVFWDLPNTLTLKDPEQKDKIIFEPKDLRFDVEIKEEAGSLNVRKFSYSFSNNKFGMEAKSQKGKRYEYELIWKSNYQYKRRVGRQWPLPSPVKFYRFPDEVSGRYENVGFLSDIVLEFERLFVQTAYLGPLREYPKRIYTWAGDAPSDVGRKGELAVAAILAAQSRGKYISPGPRRRKRRLEETLAVWLQKMGIIHSFSVEGITEMGRDYKVRVKKTVHSPEVLITDVGFGVSQVLPVLVMCYYVPEGSVLLLEQPELHLHPSAQCWLADVFIDVVKNRNVQIIVESHSEHFLRRLLRRIAEQTIEVDKTALYFCSVENSASKIERLDVDMFGNIRNWPTDFFGDEVGELTAKTEAAMRRQMNAVK
jgi:predicted ATPase